MALYPFGTVRQQGAQNCGIQNSLGVYDFDTTTFPTLTLANQMLNDCYRENTTYDYTFKETNVSIPFLHNISGVQSVAFVGPAVSGTITTVFSGVTTPYPQQVLNYTWRATNSLQDINTQFSGESFLGYSGNTLIPCTSYSGTPILATASGVVGYPYQLPPDISKINAIVISQSLSGQTGNGIVMQSCDWHDLETLIPIGIISASGTPYIYSEMPGLGPVNEKTIQFFPFPQNTYSGESFIVHYQKKHVDIVNDSDTQNIIPEDFQYLINYAFCEKVFELIDNPKAELMRQRKEELIVDMKQWDFNQPNKIRTWRDFNYRQGGGGGRGRSVYDTSQNIYLP